LGSRPRQAHAGGDVAAACAATLRMIDERGDIDTISAKQ
jgi:hypothetical protein